MPVEHAGDRRGFGVLAGSAVVTIIGAGNDEVIGGFELDPAAAQAGMRAPALGELPLGLRVEIGGRDFIVLVALERSLHAEVVDEALAALVHYVVLGAERESPIADHGGEP